MVECSLMSRDTGVQSQVESYQRLKKWYLIPSCLTLRIIRYVSRVKWSNPGKGVAPFLTPRCSSYWKGSFRVTLNYGHQLYFILHVRTKSLDPQIHLFFYFWKKKDYFSKKNFFFCIFFGGRSSSFSYSMWNDHPFSEQVLKKGRSLTGSKKKIIRPVWLLIFSNVIYFKNGFSFYIELK